jgi:integrase/recombinase XerD
MSFNKNKITSTSKPLAARFSLFATPTHLIVYKERKIVLFSDGGSLSGNLAQYQPADQLFPWSSRRLEYLLEDLGKAAA